MHTLTRKLLPVAAAAMLVAAGCSSSSGPKSASASSGTITIGLLTDLTGVAVGNSQTLELGVKAGIGVAAKAGYNIKYVIADTQSNPTGALSAARKLVDQDHVTAVVLVSGLGFSAAPFLTSRGIPVIGAALDGTEWQTAPNMFSVLPIVDTSKVQSTTGVLFKQLGATNIASVGYSISPASSEAAKGAAVSAQAAGLKVGYLNANVPFGSTNVGPIALAMKSAGVDGFIASILPATSFAAVQSARIAGVDLKVVLMSSGYGGDLFQGGTEAGNIAQGMYFLFAYEPVELRTAATQSFQDALRTYAHTTSDPSLDEYLGYLAVDALTEGLKAAGPNPSHTHLIQAMQGITNYNAAGLLGSHTISFAPGHRVQTDGGDLCEWVTQYSGSSFHPVPGASPICGTILEGKTVSGSS